jgi:hypothetical protein
VVAAPLVPVSIVPPISAVASEPATACAPAPVSVTFATEAVHDAWRVVRHALRALELNDPAKARDFLHEALRRIG